MAYNSSRPLTQKELEEIIENLSDLEADDKSDISEEDIVVEDFKNDFESDSDDEEDFNLPLFRLQQKLETECRSDTAGTSSSLVECENIEEEIPVQNNEERSAKDSDVNKDNIYLQIEDVPTQLRGKNGFKWSGKPEKKSFRTSSRNLVIHLPGNKGSARDVSSGLEAWSLFFSDDILNNIVTFTNMEILVQRKKYASDRPNDDEDVANTKVRPSYTRDTNLLEIRALCGLFYYAGVMNMNAVTTKELFDKNTGIPFFRATMSEARFNFLINCLRFDNRDTRAERRNNDRFAPFRDLFEAIISKSSESYTPSEYCSLDEQLVSFRGRCPFKMYIPSKPDKYGMKIITFCDAKTFYLLNAEVYVGKGSTPERVPVAEYYSLNLTKPIHGTNRNVTMDNWFTSIDSARKLHDHHSVTIVGTLKKNKTEIPQSFVQVKERKKNSAMFAFNDFNTILSYCPPKSKQKKVVLLLSTMHPEGDKPNSTHLPEIVNFYNKTKGGVDSFDQLTHRYTVARKTRRWPLRMFYNLLDSVGINSYILCIGSRARANENTHNRRTYLKKLAVDLITPLMIQRLQIPTLSAELRAVIERILNLEPEPNIPIPRLPSSGRCSFCPRKKDRKSRISCKKCNKFICLEHQSKVCPECSK